MTNLITSHSHSNSKKIGKEEFTNIHKASCLRCHMSLLDIVSSWHPWHVTFTFLVGAWSQSICVYKLSIELCKQGQSFREERRGASFLCHIEIFHSAYGALSISYIEVHCCLTNMTSINNTTPTGLGCISFTNKVVASGRRGQNTNMYIMIKSWEIKNFNNIYYHKSKGIFFILTSKWFYQLKIIIKQLKY